MNVSSFRVRRQQALRRSSGQSRALSRDGFTLIELLIVITLISLLATMGVVQYKNSVQSTREAIL